MKNLSGGPFSADRHKDTDNVSIYQIDCFYSSNSKSK